MRGASTEAGLSCGEPQALIVQQQPARLCLGCCAGGERRSTVAMVWEVLARMLAEPSQGSGLHARQAALLRGARRHLEAGHAAYMHATIQANRHLVRVTKAISQNGEALLMGSKGPMCRVQCGPAAYTHGHYSRQSRLLCLTAEQLHACMPTERIVIVLCHLRRH